MLAARKCLRSWWAASKRPVYAAAVLLLFPVEILLFG